MLSLFHEEARRYLVRFKLLKPNESIEDLLGRQIVIRFDMLKGKKDSQGCFKIANENCLASAYGMKWVKDDFILESITRSCLIQNIEISSYVLESGLKKFTAGSNCIDCFQFKIFIDYKYCVLGKIQYLTLLDNHLCLVYFEDLNEADEYRSHDELVAEKFKYLKLTEYMVL